MAERIAYIASHLRSAFLAIWMCLLMMLFLAVTVSAQVSANDSTAILEMISAGQKNKYANPDQALTDFGLALQKSKELKYTPGIVQSLLETGTVYFGSNIDKTLENGIAALEAYTTGEMENENLKARIFLMLGEAYDEKGKKDSSAYYFYLLNQLLESENNLRPELQIDLYIKLTAFWIKMDYDTSYLKQTLIKYVEKGRSATQKYPNSKSANDNLYFLQGLYHHGVKEYELAREAYLSYLEKRGENISLPRKMSVYGNIAETYLLQNNPAKAIEFLNKATSIPKKGQNEASMDFYLSVMNLMRAKALYQRKEYHQTIALINQTLKQSETSGTPLQVEAVDAHKIIADCYEKTGNISRALYHKNIYIKLHDSLLQKDKLDMVNQLEARYRISEKDKEITSQKLHTAEAENKIRSKNFLLVSSGFALLLVSVLFASWHYNSRNKQRLQQEKFRIMEQGIEIEKLNASISGEEKERSRIAHELHDGIGGLLTAAKLNFEAATLKNPLYQSTEFEQGISLLKDAASELRNTAHHLMPEILLQGGLAEAVKYYCNSLARNNSTEFVLQVLGTPRNIDTEFELSIYRITQELLQNILKHAKAKHAIVQISYHDKDLAITIEDDGIGLPENSLVQPAGMGLTSIRERIKNLRGAMNITSQPNEGTSIHLEFEYPNPKKAIA